MKQVLIFITITVAITACHSNANTIALKEKGSSAGNVKVEGSNIVEFNVNGRPVKTTGWNISRFIMDNSGQVWLNITSDMHNEKRAININVAGSMPGTYKIRESLSLDLSTHGSYYPDYKGDMMNSYAFVSGSFTVVTVDTVRGLINAWFEGRVKNSKGETLEITEGRILNGNLRPGVSKY